MIEELFNSIKRGKEGMNIGLPSGLPKLDKYTYGIQRGWLTLFGGDSGSGKTTLMLYTSVYTPFMHYLRNKDKDSSLDVNFLLFSFEMSKEVLLAKLLSLYIHETYHKVISYSTILSLNETISDEDLQYVEASKNWLLELEKKCTIIEKQLTAQQVGVAFKSWSERFGKYETDGINTTYIPNNPKQFLVVVVDHVKLLAKSAGHTDKQEIDELSQVAMEAKNLTKSSWALVQQLNRNFKSIERRESQWNLVSMEDFSDTSSTAQAAEIVVAIYHPARERNLRCCGYDFMQLGDNADRARMLLLLKQRFGIADVAMGTAFYGETGLWKQLPSPSELQEHPELYEQYKNL